MLLCPRKENDLKEKENVLVYGYSKQSSEELLTSLS